MPLTPVIMPKTGAEMEEGRIVAWKRQEGERVKKGEVLLEIETDKANMEVESPAEGTVLRRLFNEGDTAPATSVIALLGDGSEPAEEIERALRGGPPAQPKPATATAPEPPPAAPRSVERKAVTASPLARRLAQEKGIDLASIRGSGEAGRIEKDDVLRAAEAKATALPPSAEVLIPLSPMRRAVGRRVRQSKQEMPDFSVTAVVDMTAVLRKKSALEGAGKRVSINDLIVFAVAKTLTSHPDLNAQLEGDVLRRHSEINIGVAVGADGGLYVPVVRRADKLSVEEIAAETARLAAKIEKKQITEDDMAGGTFTVSNLGMFGVESFTAIILPPQTGILSVGAIVDRPVRGASGELEWQPSMAATLTVDHRVIDGLAAAMFLRDLKAQFSAL
jgi:pyruvate dehydrogenase E2 component (dihydrolipoamide acetyltransferase)